MNILDALRADTLFAVRRLLKSTMTSAAAVLSLALAMGACLAAFQLIDALLLRPLDVAGPDRLYAIIRPGAQSSGNDGWQYPLVRQMRDAVHDKAAVLAVSFAEQAELTFRSDEEMEKAHLQYVSGSLFNSFGLHAAAGRLITRDDDLQPGGHPVAVLSNDYWIRRFGKDPTVVGQAFRLPNNLTGDRIYRIIGVVREGFTGTEPGKVIDIFLPAMMHWGIQEPNWQVFRIFAHLNPGITAPPVEDRMNAVLRAFNEEKAREHPAQRLSLARQVLAMEPAAAGVSGMQKDYRVSLAALSVLVVLVLLIACANVANLMSAQAASRSREMALRVSIGAGRWRLAQLMLVESALVGLSAAVLGWCFSRWAARLVIDRINPTDNPARLDLSIDWRLVLFGVALTLIVTCLFGLTPALRASSVEPVSALKGDDDRHARGYWMRALIAAQAAFGFIVLMNAGLFVATFDRLSHQSAGFPVNGLVNLKIVNPKNEPIALWDQVVARLRSLPGVDDAAYSDWPLLDGYGFKLNGISINGGPPTEDPAWFLNVSQGWMHAMKIPFLDGRDFRSTDLSPGAAIVNQTFARMFFRGGNPIGKWFEGTSGYMRGQRFQIVGLVRDARYRYLREPVLPVAYTPFQRMENKGTMQGGTLVVRVSTSNPLALAAVLAREVPRVRPEFRVSTVHSQQELNDSQVVRERLLAMIARFFALVALLLAGVGLYGVLDYSVVQRQREIGIRLALGARPRDVARRVTANILAMVALGAAAGLALGMGLVRYTQSLLFQVKATDVSVLAVPALTILGVAIAAALPAVIRAVKIDPAHLLRTE